MEWTNLSFIAGEENNFNVPVLGIRVISNNEILGEKYDRNTGLYSQKFAYTFVKNMILQGFIFK